MSECKELERLERRLDERRIEANSLRAENATLRAGRDRAEAVPKALRCGGGTSSTGAIPDLRLAVEAMQGDFGNDSSTARRLNAAIAALESWAAGQGERPADAPDTEETACYTCRHMDVREDMIPCIQCMHGHPSKWEPKPAPEPEKPKCKRCGAQTATAASEGYCKGCLIVMDMENAEASRVAKLRARLESSSDDNAVKDTRGGGVAIVYYPLAVLDGRVRVRDNDGVMTWWNLADVTLLVPEGESHE